MRRPLCLTLLGVVFAACNGGEDGIGPTDPCADATADTVFFLWPESMRLVLGAADEAYIDGALLQCNQDPVALSDIDWTVRDPSIAAPRPESPNGSSLLLVAAMPGETWVLADALGRSDSLRVIVPDTVPMGPSAWIAAGSETSCSVADTNQVFCWGVGYGSLLGDPWLDPAVGTCWGAPCSPMPVPRMTGAVSVRLGWSHACALDAAGTALCWGDNELLQLGGGSTGTYAEPVEAGAGRAFASLSLGAQHTCGLTSVGEAYCWGSHLGGRLGGDQRTGPVASPVLVSSTLLFSSIDGTGNGTCGSSDTGVLYCWGYFPAEAPPPDGAETCELAGGKGGPDSLPCSFVPLRMPLGEGHGTDSVFVEIRGDCALTTEGSVSCYDPDIGAFERMDGFGPFRTLVAGRGHNCGLTPDGTARCWGDGGALGDGTQQSRTEPVAVSGGHVFDQLAAGGEHTCGRTTDGTVWCWGLNQNGQAGVPVLERPLTPARVRGQG